jgi:hypothetical protein
MGDDGVEADGRSSNVRIWGNEFRDVLMGISLAPAYDGPTYAIRNLVHRTGVGNNTYTGSPFKFNSGYDQSGPMFLFHNTGDAFYPENNGLYIKAPGSWTMIIARNNIWSGTDYAVNNYNTEQTVDFDHDDLWNAEYGPLVRWAEVDYGTLQEFSDATGQEVNGLNVDPGFVDPAAGDYSLDPASSLIDAGVRIPGINDDYAGDAPDIGAIEYRPGSSVPGETVDPAALLRCHPNPFVSGTVLHYRLMEPSSVDIAVFDPSGRRVALLRSGAEEAGMHAVIWNGTNNLGQSIGAGVYFIRARIAGRTEIARVVRVE